MKTCNINIKKAQAALGIGLILLALHQAQTARSEETTLREKLLERASQSKMPAEKKAKMMQQLKQLTDSDLVSNAKNTGDKAPDFKLKDHEGKERSLSEYLKDGPVILTWYRGGW